MNQIKLNVPYYLQWDSATWQGGRMCFSSTCAMLLEFLIPEALKGGAKQEDDEYLAKVNTRGDTTIGAVQEATLKSFGLTSARFRTNLQWSDIDQQLSKGIPIPVGWLIRGNVNLPVGSGGPSGGHWSLIVGKTTVGDYIFHDPNGECNLVSGGYTNYQGGKFVVYSKANFDKRWRVNGKPGWGIMCDHVQPQVEKSKAPEKNVFKVTPIKAKIKGKDALAWLFDNDAVVLARDVGGAWDGATRSVIID